MATFFLEHMPGCTPIRPCESCAAVNFLRSKLSEADFKELITKIKPVSTPIPLEASIEALDLPIRSANCLKVLNILTIGDLVKKSETELLVIPNLGRKSLNEIKENLAAVGRRIGEFV